MNIEAIRDLIGDVRAHLDNARDEVCEECELKVLTYLQEAESTLDELLLALDAQERPAAAGSILRGPCLYCGERLVADALAPHVCAAMVRAS